MFNNKNTPGRNYKTFYCLCTLLFLFFASANAQKGSGKLTGKITDAATNESMSGVSISPKGKSNGTSSITDGTYILTLPAGTYTIVFSYTGYQKKEISGIVIKAGESTFFDAILQQLNNQLEGVVVTSTVKKESQSSVYNKQKISSAASDGISQEAISKTPDTDAGQVLKRVTGINVQDNKFVVVRGLGAQYNQTMLNGVAMTSTETNQNAFSFDLVPSSVIDNIVVNKTATPDMPGNFAGGVVQVNTKDFPSRNFFSIAVQGGFSDKTQNKDFYSDKRGSLEWLSFGDKNRDLPEGFPQAKDRVDLGKLNSQERFRYLKMLPNTLTPVNNGHPGLNENVQLGYGKTIRFDEKGQFGIIAALTQRKASLTENEVVMREPEGFRFGSLPKFRQYSQNTRYKFSSELAGVLNLAYSFGDNKITLKNLYSNVFKNTFIKRDSAFSFSFGFPDEEVEGFSYLVEQRALLNTILGGEHKTGRNKETKLDWNVNMTMNKSKFPDTRNFLLAKNSEGRYTSNNLGVSLLELLGGMSRFWTTTKDVISGGAFNATTVTNIFNSKTILKGGVLFQNRRREATGTPIAYLSGFSNKNLDSILAPSGYGPDGTDILLGSSGDFANAGNYNSSTSLLAAYESMENKIGKTLRIIWGLRVENYQQSVNVYAPRYYDDFRDPDLLIVKLGARTTFNFLPSINVVYSPLNSINVRGAFSNTVIRPDLQDLAEYTRYDYQIFQLSSGNSNLKSTDVSNYDLKLEWFPSSSEIISVAGFYKKLINPIEYGQPTETNILVGKVALNTGNATVKGIEGEIRKKLDFLKFAPWLANVTLFGNGSLFKSNVETITLNNKFVSSVPEHRLSGQSNYIINVGTSISALKNSFEATVSLNRTGDYINQLGSSLFEQDPIGGIPILTVPHYIVRARNMVDIGVKQSFLKRKAQVKFNISNLLSKPLLVYQDYNGNGKYDSPAFVIDRSAAGQGRVISGIDNNASYTIGQRTYFLSFTYTF